MSSRKHAEGTQAAKKRHKAAEIEAKLEQAAALSAQGRTQSEIAQALGISVMTFHRWRKALAPPVQAAALGAGRPNVPLATVADLFAPRRQARFTELQVENARLRKLVTDLLLEKMRLDDEAQRGL